MYFNDDKIKKLIHETKIKKQNKKINLDYNKFSVFTKITIKHDIHGKTNLYSRCFDRSFKKLETIGEEEFSGL